MTHDKCVQSIENDWPILILDPLSTILHLQHFLKAQNTEHFPLGYDNKLSVLSDIEESLPLHLGVCELL